MLTTIMARDTQMAETGMTPPSATESSPESTVRIAMMGIISKTESSRLKTKEAIKFFRCFSRKFQQSFHQLNHTGASSPISFRADMRGPQLSVKRIVP